MGLFILFIKNEVLGDHLTHLLHPVRCRIILLGQINLISGIECNCQNEVANLLIHC